MKYGNKIFLKGGIKNVERDYANIPELFDRWINGKTDDDFVNANMIELKETGFMSNRGRQNAASYLIHDLNIDWRWGAGYFESMLIDYDVCSNWGNWMYVAGVGNDPRPNRKFNTQFQAEKYDKNYDYRNLWLNKAEIEA
jgi:deoxyribodipyrimidine photo-lyase